MKGSKLKNNFNKNRNHENWCKYKIQRNYSLTTTTAATQKS